MKKPSSNPTDDAASRSGLFSPGHMTKTANPKPDRKAKPLAAEIPTQSTASMFAVQKNVFDAIRESIRLEGKTAGNKSLWNLAGKIADDVDHYSKLSETLGSELAHAREEAVPVGPVAELTVAELIERVTVALRDSRATPTDVKTLSQVLRELSPGTFAAVDGVAPDPCAIAEFLCGWAGMTGERILATVGGVAKMEAELSECLKASVSIALPDSGAN